MTSPMPMPMGEGPAVAESPDYSPSSMLGAYGSPGPSPEMMRQQTLQNAVAQARVLEQAVLDLASQFPAAAQDARMVVQGIRSMLRGIIASTGGQEPAAPRMIG